MLCEDNSEKVVLISSLTPPSEGVVFALMLPVESLEEDVSKGVVLVLSLTPPSEGVVFAFMLSVEL